MNSGYAALLAESLWLSGFYSKNLRLRLAFRYLFV